MPQLQKTNKIRNRTTCKPFSFKFLPVFGKRNTLACVKITKVSGEAFLGKYAEQSPSEASTSQKDNIKESYDTNPQGFNTHHLPGTSLEPKQIGLVHNIGTSVAKSFYGIRITFCNIIERFNTQIRF